MSKEAIEQVADNIVSIIESTIRDGNQIFDGSCKRMATGLIQDLSTGLGQGISNYLLKIMEMLFIVLEDNNMATDVKTISIVAIGDICLMSEASF